MADTGARANVPHPNVALAHVVLGAFLLLGTPFGVVAFGPGLLRHGAFEGLCESAARPCYAQKVALAQAFSFIILGANLTMLPLGQWVDRHGPRGVFRWCIVACGLGFAISGVDLRWGWPFAIGMTVASNAGSVVGGIGLGGVLPQLVPVESMDRWAAVLGSLVDLGSATAVPFGFWMLGDALPLWAWFMIMGAMFLAIFLPLHHFGITQAPPVRSESCNGQSAFQLMRRQEVQLLIVYFGVVMTFTSGIEAASLRLLELHGHSSTDERAILVPLVAGVAGFVLSGVLYVTGSDHIHVGFPLRMVMLASVVILLCSLGYFGGTWPFWTLIAAMSGLRGLSMQALFRMQLATAPVGHEGAVTGLTWTIGGLGAILPGQAVTYLLPYSPFARTCTAVFFAVTIAVIDVVNVRILTLRHPSAQRTGTSPPDEGTALIESLPA